MTLNISFQEFSLPHVALFSPKVMELLSFNVLIFWLSNELTSLDMLVIFIEP